MTKKTIRMSLVYGEWRIDPILDRVNNDPDNDGGCWDDDPAIGRETDD